MEGESLGPGSISQLIGGLRSGDGEAIQRLWQRYFQSMVRLASVRLTAGGGLKADAEDVALDAFFELSERLRQETSDQSFPVLQNRNHLWGLLACFTVREAFDLATKQSRRRRVVVDESVLGVEGLQAIADRDPPVEFAAAVADLLEYLPNEALRAVAMYRMEGYTQREIAHRLGCALSTVERKLQVIRVLWKDMGGEKS